MTVRLVAIALLIAASGLASAAGLTLSSGFSDAGSVKQYGYGAGYYGALAPTTFLSRTISAVVTQATTPAGDADGFWIVMDGAQPRNLFSIVIVNGSVFVSASATYFVVGTRTAWFWPGQFPIGAGVYTLTLF